MIEEHQKGWSFCFVTGGTDDATYSACLESIYNEFDGRDDFEIISVGTSSLHEERRPKFKTVFFSEPVLHLSLKNFRRARKMKSFKTLFFELVRSAIKRILLPVMHGLINSVFYMITWVLSRDG